MTATPDQIVAYLKAHGMHDAIAAQALLAAGHPLATHVSTVTKGQPDAGDVHVPTSGKRPKPVVGQAAKDEDGDEVAKAVRRSWDVDFQKADAGLYVCRYLTKASAERLHAWAKEQGIPNLVPPELMHVTQAHSKDMPADIAKVVPDLSLLTVAQSPRWTSPIGDQGAIALFVSVPEMQARFKQFAAAGAQWQFAFYQPHITLTYDGKGSDWANAEGPNFDVQLGPEVWSSNNEDWVKEKDLRKVEEFTMTLAVTKAEPDKRQIMGWASVSSINGVEVIDKQGDIIPIEELEKAATDYNLWSRQQGEMHNRMGVGRLIGSCVYTPEKALMPDGSSLVAKNANGEVMMGWWVEFLVDDDATWAAIKRGELPEFSIGGKATPVPV